MCQRKDVVTLHEEKKLFFSNFAFSVLFIVKGIRETAQSAHFTIVVGAAEKAHLP